MKPNSGIVTVIIPTYNGEPFVAEALESVFAQSLHPREIIVVDDASKDNTAAIVEKQANSSPIPIRLIRLPHNSGGPAKPINVGIGAAKSELISVLDQDDRFAPAKLEKEVTVLATNPRLSVAAGLLAYLGEPDRIQPAQTRISHDLGVTDPSSAGVVPGETVLRCLLLEGQFLSGYPAFTFRRAHWAEKAGLDERLPVASDYDLLCWLCSKGDVCLHYCIHYLRREHEHNVCNNRLKMYLDMARVRSRYLRQHREFLSEASLSQAMREFFMSFGFFSRRAGQHLASLECYTKAASLWGWDTEITKSVIKLPLHFLLHLSRIRKPVQSFYTESLQPVLRKEQHPTEASAN